MSVVIETTLGDVTVDLYIDQRPRACLNFLKLCKLKYYNYNLFHTISRGFVAQTGDPTGSRTGGESVYGVLQGPSKRFFEAEDKPRMKHTTMGKLSFVGNDENMIGSQFFITLGEDLTYLDDKHCIFGEVVEGFDVLEVINEVICDTDDRPYQDVRITHTVILDDPFPDPKTFNIPSRSPSPSTERLRGGRIAPDEDIDETEGKNAKEVAEMQAEREAKARATILEMVGDIPDAEMAPPENVLFVCKLNPVTTDDDLEIIFSRFGKIKSCEVIRDRKTGDSLQYAFIEFEERKSCEEAYFKMDNVLIDDRRIHVDFSQSVSKVKWLGKGRGVAHFDEKGKKRTDDNNDIGKGNYKIKNGEDRSRNSSQKGQTSGQLIRREHSRSPVRNRERSDEYRSRDDSRRSERYRRASPDRNRRNYHVRDQERYVRREEYRREDRRYKQDDSGSRHYRVSSYEKVRIQERKRERSDVKEKNGKSKQRVNKSSEDESSEEETRKQKDAAVKKKQAKKSRKTYSSDESSSDASEPEKKKKKSKKSKKSENSSSEDEKKKKKRKATPDSDVERKSKKSKKKKKRKRSSSDSSD